MIALVHVSTIEAVQRTLKALSPNPTSVVELAL